MKPILKTLAALAVTLLGCGAFTQQAHATFIAGGISFSGSGNVTTSAGVTTISYDSSGPGEQKVSSTQVNNGGDDYSVIANGTVVSFTSLSFSNSSLLTLENQSNPFWSVDGYTFGLTSLYSNTFTNLTTTFVIHGNGYATGPGYATTAATYAIQAAYVSAGVYDFTLTDYTIGSGVGVPDGGQTLALLGIAFTGLGVLRRKLAA